MKKAFLLWYFIICSFTALAQNPELFRKWYLTQVTVDGTTYVSSDYGFYPDVTVGMEGLSLADPDNVLCEAIITEFITTPQSFLFDNSWLCFPKTLCSDNPISGPCSVMYGNHSDIYYLSDGTITYSISNEGNGIYTLQVENNLQNTATYSSVLLNIDDFKENNIAIYPNPVSNELNIQNLNGLVIKNMILYNIQGQAVYKTSEIKQTLEVSFLPAGMYFIEITSESGRVVKKFIKN